MTSETYLIPIKYTTLCYIKAFDAYLLHISLLVYHHPGEMYQLLEKPTNNLTLIPGFHRALLQSITFISRLNPLNYSKLRG